MEELRGAPVAKEITANLVERVAALQSKGIAPKLAIVRMGENPGDMAYERGALNRMAKVGVEAEVHALPADTSQAQLEELLDTLSANPDVHSILLMRPLPKGMDEAAVATHVDPRKDVDGMTIGSLAKVLSGKGEGFAPCTAEAVMALLKHYQVPLEGKRVVVLGRSLVIGKPVSQLLLAKNATVTVCHSKTQNLAEVCQEADVIVSCMGKAHMVTSAFVKPGCTIVDVSTNDDGNGSITGDIDTEDVSTLAISLTPVPGGVGSVTTSILATHVVEAAEHSVIL